MPEDSYIGPVAKVAAIERLSLADRSGLLVGDIILHLGNRNPLEAIEDHDMLMSLGNKEWITVLRDKVIFKLLFGSGLRGLELVQAELLEEVKEREDPRWKSYLSAVRPGESLLILPEIPPVHWWPIPIIAWCHVVSLWYWRRDRGFALLSHLWHQRFYVCCRGLERAERCRTQGRLSTAFEDRAFQPERRERIGNGDPCDHEEHRHG